ncbi:MAG: DUF192 domain-containing protein [Aggregatilineales bacterium]
MSEWRVIRNAKTDEVVLARAKLCASFWSHFKGLQFSPRLPADEGLLFVTKHEGRSHTAIHMFFVFFPIAVVWLDGQGFVVDQALAKPWHPYYAPARPAQYFIEADPQLLERVAVGDRLHFDEVAR